MQPEALPPQPAGEAPPQASPAPAPPAPAVTSASPALAAAAPPPPPTWRGGPRTLLASARVRLGRAAHLVRGAGPMSLLPMLLSLVAVLFAVSSWQQMQVASSGLARTRSSVAARLRSRLARLGQSGSVTLDLATLEGLLQDSAGAEEGGNDEEEAEAEERGEGGSSASGWGAAAPASVLLGEDDGGGRPQGVAAAAADPPGLLLERDSEWAGEGDDGSDDDGLGGDGTGRGGLRRPAARRSRAAAASRRTGGGGGGGGRKGLTRAELVARQLLRAHELVPRNRADEPPRQRQPEEGEKPPKPRACDLDERYLHLLTAREGMSAWIHTLHESITAANALGRTFVEPCVAGGLLLPCTPGRVLPVPEGPRDTDYPTTAQDDALAVPAFEEHCAATHMLAGEAQFRASSRRSGALLMQDFGIAANISRIDGRSYPLSLYMDVAVLRRQARRWSSFSDWVRCTFLDARTGREELTDVRRSRGLVHASLAYCISAGDGPLALTGTKDASCVTAVGPYRFRRVWWPRGLPALRAAGNTSTTHMSSGFLPLLRADSARDMFFYNVWRGFWRRYGSLAALPRFNPIHTLAVRAWLARRLDVGGALGRRPEDVEAEEEERARALQRGRGRGEGWLPPSRWDGYALFQWRSETVHKDLMVPCARKLAGLAGEALAALRLVARAGGVLAADLPAVNNPCAQWHVYEGTASENSERRRALASLEAAGLAKYDADHPGIDAGVLAIRDWVLATNARWYITCHARDPKECELCFRSTSKYVGRIIDVRNGTGRGSITNWFQLPADGLQQLEQVRLRRVEEDEALRDKSRREARVRRRKEGSALVMAG